MLFPFKKERMSASSAESLGNKIDKANKAHRYIHVFKKEDGTFKTSLIKLSGYQKMFKDTPTFMYARTLRHAGKSEDLLEYMGTFGYSTSEVHSYLNDSYNASNYEANLDIIEGEIATIPVEHKEKREVISLDSIISMRGLLDNFKPTVSKSKDEIPEPSTPKVKGARTDLKSRLEGLETDKVLDITHFDPSKGTGIKTTKRTKGTRKPLSSVGDLNRVVFDFNKGTDIAVSALIAMGFAADRATAVVAAAQTIKPQPLSNIAINHA